MIETCIIGYGAINCTDDCSKCGFNPDVAAKRKAAIHSQRKPEPPKPPRMVNFEDVLTAVKGLLEYAEKRLDEESRNGEDYDIRYWVAYRDSVKGTLSALEQMGGGNNADA